MLNFVRQGKKLEWEIYNSEEDFLGRIERKRVGRFMHFVFVPLSDTYLTNGCLKEIRYFITKCYGVLKNEK